MKLLVAAFFITILLTAYSARIPPEERYRGFQVFQVIFKSHDNTSAIANYAKSKEKGVSVPGQKLLFALLVLTVVD